MAPPLTGPVIDAVAKAETRVAVKDSCNCCFNWKFWRGRRVKESAPHSSERNSEIEQTMSVYVQVKRKMSDSETK